MGKGGKEVTFSANILANQAAIKIIFLEKNTII